MRMKRDDSRSGPVGSRCERNKPSICALLRQRVARSVQSCARGDDIVDDQHPQAIDARAGDKRRTPQPVCPTTTRLGRRIRPFEQPSTGQPQLPRDRSGQQLTLIKPTLTPTASARRRPCHDVDVLIGLERDQTVHDEPRQVTSDRTPIPVLQSEDDAPHPPGKGQRRDHAVIMLSGRGREESESARRTNWAPRCVATGATCFEDHATHLSQRV